MQKNKRHAMHDIFFDGNFLLFMITYFYSKENGGIPMKTQDLLNLLKNHKVYIQTHNFPDPDAISSAFALQEFLKFHEISSRLCYDGRIDRLSSKKMLDTFGIEMTFFGDIPDMTEEDYIVLVDSQKLNSNVTDFIGDEVACIDHHPDTHRCTYKYLDLQITGACATIIASYYYDTNTPISTQAASALVYGIKMDTADFTRGTTQKDLDMFHFLSPFCDWELIKDMYSNTLEYDDLRAYGAAIQNITLYGSTGFAYIPFNCAPALIAIISDFILSLDIIDLAIVYARNKDGIRFSIRSERPQLSAGTLIGLALDGLGGGGGHPSMAGGMIPEENVPKLGNTMQATIHQIFLRAEETLNTI